MASLEDFLRLSSRALVIGVGGGGDVVGALATARFLEFCGVDFVLGGLSWENPSVDAQPGPRSLLEVQNVQPLHEYAWLANERSQTKDGILFAESRMAGIIGRDTLLLDISGGVTGVIEALNVSIDTLRTDLLVGVDVGGDSLAQGEEPGLRSPLADSIMLAAFSAIDSLGVRALWSIFGYGSDGELTTDEIEVALGRLAKREGLLGSWGLTTRTTRELDQVVARIPTEASAIPVACAHGATGYTKIRQEQAVVRLTPLSTVTFFLSPAILFDELSAPARAVKDSSSLEEANDALHTIGLRTELDFERSLYRP